MTALLLIVLTGCDSAYSADGYWEGLCSSSLGDSYGDILVMDILESNGGDLLAELSLAHTGNEPATEMFSAIAAGTRERDGVSLEFELEETYWGGLAVISASYAGTINEDRSLTGAWGFQYDRKEFSFECRSARANKP